MCIKHCNEPYREKRHSMRDEANYKSWFRFRDTSNSPFPCNYCGSDFISCRHQPGDLSKEMFNASERRVERVLLIKKEMHQLMLSEGLSVVHQISRFKWSKQVRIKGRLDHLQAFMSCDFPQKNTLIASLGLSNSLLFSFFLFLRVPELEGDQRTMRKIFKFSVLLRDF